MTPARVSAWATGVGIGVLTFMVTWLILNRLLDLWLPLPAAPVTALVAAVAAGTLVSVERARALAKEDTNHPN